MATIETTDYLDTEQVASRLDMPVETVQRYCLNALQGRTPAIKGTRFGRSWFVHKDEVARFKSEKRKPGRPVAN